MSKSVCHKKLLESSCLRVSLSLMRRALADIGSDPFQAEPAHSESPTPAASQTSWHGLWSYWSLQPQLLSHAMPLHPSDCNFFVLEAFVKIKKFADYESSESQFCGRFYYFHQLTRIIRLTKENSQIATKMTKCFISSIAVGKKTSIESVWGDDKLTRFHQAVCASTWDLQIDIVVNLIRDLNPAASH